MLTRNIIIGWGLLALLAAPPAVPPLPLWKLTPDQIEQAQRLATEAVQFRLDHPVKNWTAWNGSGSCVHAALVNLLRWQGQREMADWWQTRYAGGESFQSITQKLDASGLRWAGTNRGDESFLEAACHTRRGAGVVVQNGAHMVCLVGLTPTTAQILDSNHPGQITNLNRAEFLRTWHQSGGWAITPVYTPPPPKPWRIRKEGEQ